MLFTLTESKSKDYVFVSQHFTSIANILPKYFLKLLATVICTAGQKSVPFATHNSVTLVLGFSR